MREFEIRDARWFFMFNKEMIIFKEKTDMVLAKLILDGDA